jgi:hypothetical protein
MQCDVDIKQAAARFVAGTTALNNPIKGKSRCLRPSYKLQSEVESPFRPFRDNDMAFWSSSQKHCPDTEEAAVQLDTEFDTGLADVIAARRLSSHKKTFAGVRRAVVDASAMAGRMA